MSLKLQDIPGRIYLRYLLLLIPGTLLLYLVLIIIDRFILMPSWLFWGIMLVRLASEVVIFPFVWRSYDPNQPGISRSMVGERGIVKKRLDPSGYIQIGGELWRAESVEAGLPVEIGQVVQVTKMEGLKLLVRFESSGN